MYGAFDMNGNGSLSSSERALMHEVLSGNGSSSYGAGYRRNKTTSGSTGITIKEPTTMEGRLIFWGIWNFVLIAATVFVFWFMISCMIEADLSGFTGFIAGTIIFGPVAILFLGVDFVSLLFAYWDISNAVKKKAKEAKKKKHNRGSLMRKITYANFIMAIDILLIVLAIIAHGRIKAAVEEAKIRKEQAVEQAAIDERIAKGLCLAGLCEKHSTIGSVYCRMHTCEAPGCANEVVAFDRCELHKTGHVDSSIYAVIECITDGCNKAKAEGSPYCSYHRPYRPAADTTESDTALSEQTVSPATQTTKPSGTGINYERSSDDLDIDGYYEDYREEFEDADDAWDDLDDDEDAWDDY